MTFASIVAIVVMLYIGELIDQKKLPKLLPIGAVFYGYSWLFRFLATGIGTLVGFDIATRLGKAMVNVPLLATTYSIAGTSGPDHAIAYAVFYEFSLAVGKVFTALLAIWILSLTGSIPLVFMFVGVLTMFYGLLRK